MQPPLRFFHFKVVKPLFKSCYRQGVYDTRIEALVHRQGQTSPRQMASAMIGDSPHIRREVQRRLTTGEYKHLDLRTQTPNSIAQLEPTIQQA